jgi:Protein of unknown function (DUF2523)
MANIAAWLLALIGPLVVRGLTAVGFTALVFTGVEALVNQLVANAQTQWSTMPLAVLQLSSLAGFPDALGIVFGALLGRFALKAAVGASQYVFRPK